MKRIITMANKAGEQTPQIDRGTNIPKVGIANGTSPST